MSYTLGDITLSRPKSMKRTQRFIKTDVVTLDGSTKRDVIARKETFNLSFELLTQTEVNQIISEYNKNTQVQFTVSETNLSIDTSVLVDIKSRNYNTKGDQYREDLDLILIEV